MTPTEAYYFTMSKVDELKDSGIEVLIKPSNTKNNQEMIKKYNQPGRTPPELWNHISFKVSDKQQSKKIFDMANYLGLCGISFDTGGCIGQRDWELDWSFRFKKGEEDWDLRDARDEVEDMLNNM